MSSTPRPRATDPVVAARRELHELTVLASAMLRLATKVQARCDALRHTLGDVAPLDQAEVDRYAPRSASGSGNGGDPQAGADAPTADGGEDPASLLAMSLAGEGMSREQIAEYLEESFGMEETDEMLERVLPEEEPGQ